VLTHFRVGMWSQCVDTFFIFFRTQVSGLKLAHRVDVNSAACGTICTGRGDDLKVYVGDAAGAPDTTNDRVCLAPEWAKFRGIFFSGLLEGILHSFTNSAWPRTVATSL
jgi:hypothetical protein